MDKRLQQARFTGKLLLACMNLEVLPEMVWNLYESSETAVASFDQQSKGWWEQVDLTSIDLSDNLLTELSDKFVLFEALRSIDARRNRLVTLSDGFLALQHLTHLNLSDNQLSIMPKLHFSSLVLLDVSKNKIRHWDDDCFLPSLQVLDLSENQLEQVPPFIQSCRNLEKLSLHLNRLLSVPLLHLEKLRHLSVAENNISSLFHPDSRFDSLSFLDAHRNILKSPVFSFVLPQCQTLLLSFNTISTMDDISLACPKLEVLDIHNNKISSVPDVPATIKRFDISNNNLSEPPLSLLNTKIEYIRLDGNLLRGVPNGTDAIMKWLSKKKPLPNDQDSMSDENLVMTNVSENAAGKLANGRLVLSNSKLSNATLQEYLSSVDENIIELDLEKNELTDMPSFDKIQAMITCRAVNLSWNRASKLSQSLELPNLTFLDLSHNHLAHIDTRCFQKLPLDTLNLCFNAIASFGGNLPLPPTLTTLLLSTNKISVVPPGILPQSIQTLDISNNEIRQLPAELARFPSLTTLKVEGNTFRVPSQAVVSKGSKAVLNYLKSRLS